MTPSIKVSSIVQEQIKKALEKNDVLWQKGDEAILSIPEKPKRVLKVFSGPNASKLFGGNLRRKIQLEIPGLDCGFGVIGLDLAPLFVEDKVYVQAVPFPKPGVFLKQPGKNTGEYKDELDNIAETVTREIGPEAIDSCWVYNLEGDGPNYVYLVSLQDCERIMKK